MRSIFYSWVVSAAINFALRQLAKWRAETNWETVLADAKERIAALVPGTFWDDEAQRLVTVLVAAAQRALSNEQPLERLLKHLAEGEYQEAGKLFRDLLLKAFQAEDFRKSFGSHIVSDKQKSPEERKEAAAKQEALARVKSFVESYDPLA